MRLCRDALDGKLTQHTKCLSVCFAKRRGFRTVEARYLPFLHALLRAKGKENENLKWLRTVTDRKIFDEIKDAAIQRFLTEETVLATR